MFYPELLSLVTFIWRSYFKVGLSLNDCSVDKQWKSKNVITATLFMIEFWYCDTFGIPTQFPTHGQWWSNLAMQRLHTAQCLDLMGLRICRVKKRGQSEHSAQTSSVLIIASCQRVYQAGAAEYAQIQAARLCQLHDRLEEGNQTIKQRLQKKTKDMAEKKWMNNWEINLSEVYLAPQQKIYWRRANWGWLGFPTDRLHRGPGPFTVNWDKSSPGTFYTVIHSLVPFKIYESFL